jgi:hypothetical protein
MSFTQCYAYILKILKQNKIAAISRRRRRELNDKLMSGRREKSPEYNGTNIVLV